METVIHQLPETVSSQLRSGVAITSVAQCVEELVLNSLDAGATCIAVRLDLSCFKIQVVDNGSGIPYSQMDLLASRHHTSKCNELQDLDNLEYFGFRGEALASIVEIATLVDIVSRIKHCSKTYVKLFARGKQKAVTESKTCRPSAGTTVTIHDLFNKLPVRKKTINPGLELEKVKQRLEGIALMHPSISLSLRNDENNNKILQSRKCNSTIGVFRHLFGSVRATAYLKEVCCTMGSFTVQGFISSEGHINKNLQFVYINSRLVLKTKIHKLLNKVLSKFYSSRRKVSELTLASKSSPYATLSPTKQSDKHSIFLVNVTCAYNEYDITFDPSKTLVEFKDWETVLSAVEGVVKDFKAQLSPDISCQAVNTEESVATTIKDEVLGVQPEGENVAVTCEISTATTARSLHSKLVKRPSFGLNEWADDINLKSVKETARNFAKSGLELNPTDCKVNQSNCSENEFPQNDLESSDTLSGGDVDCGKHVINCVEDPLSVSTLGNQDNQLPNDDSEMETEFTPNLEKSASCISKSSDLRTPTVQTEGFSDLFQQPLLSRLSSLKQKVKTINQENTSLIIKDKIKQLKESVNISGEATKHNQTLGISRSLQRLKDELFSKKGNSTETSDSIQNLSLAVSLDKKRRSPLKQTKSAKLARLVASTTCADVNEASSGKGMNCCPNEHTRHCVKSTKDIKPQDLSDVNRKPTEAIPSTYVQGNINNSKITLELANLTNKTHPDLKRSSDPVLSTAAEHHMPGQTGDPGLISIEGKGHSFIEPFSKIVEHDLSNSDVNIDKRVVCYPENKDLKSHNYLTSDTFLIPFSSTIQNSTVTNCGTVSTCDIGMSVEPLHRASSSGGEDSAHSSILSADQSFPHESLSNETVKPLHTIKDPENGVNPCTHKCRDNVMPSCSSTSKRQPMVFNSPEGCIRLSPDSQTDLNSSELFKGYGNSLSDLTSFESLTELYSSIRNRVKPAEPMHCEPSQGFDFRSLHVVQDTLSLTGNQAGYNSLGFKLDSPVVDPRSTVFGGNRSETEDKSSELVSFKDSESSVLECMEIDNNDNLKCSSNKTEQTHEKDIENDTQIVPVEIMRKVKFPDSKESAINLGSDAETVCSDKDLVELLITPSSETEVQRSCRSTPPQPNQPAFFGSSFSEQVSTSDILNISPQIMEMDHSDQLLQAEDHQNILSLPLTGLTNTVKQGDLNSVNNGAEDYTIVSVLRSTESESSVSPLVSSQMAVPEDNLLSPSMQTAVPEHVARTTVYRNYPIDNSRPVDNLDLFFTKITTRPQPSLNESVSLTSVGTGFKIPHLLTTNNQKGSKCEELAQVEDQLPVNNVYSKVKMAKLDTSLNSFNSKRCVTVKKGETVDMTQSALDDNQKPASANRQNQCEKEKTFHSVVDQITKSSESATVDQESVESTKASLANKTKQIQSETDLVMIKQRDPTSGRKIFIHPLTGHTLSESAWELWRKQNPVPHTSEDDCSIYQRKKLLPHDLANQLSTKPTPNICQSENTATSSTESSGQGGLSIMWSDHVTGQFEVDNVKWRHPMTEETANESTSNVITELFEEWHNPVFTVPEQDVVTAELPGRQTAAVKAQKALHPCRFTKSMLTQSKVLGQVDDKFIACLMRTNDKNLSAEANLLVLVDQHAAHERVRLEQLTQDAFVCDESGEVKVLKRSEVKPPMELILTEDNVRVITTYQEKFLIMGIEFKISEKRDTISLETLPACFMEREANEIKRGRNSIIKELVETFIKEQVELLKNTHGVLPQVPPSVHKLLCSQACHGAIKFGDSLGMDECCDFVESLSLCNLPFQCAHGRPSVMPLLNLDDYKNKFPEKVLKKPRLWKLRQAIEESELS